MDTQIERSAVLDDAPFTFITETTDVGCDEGCLAMTPDQILANLSMAGELAREYDGGIQGHWLTWGIQDGVLLIEFGRPTDYATAEARWRLTLIDSRMHDEPGQSPAGRGEVDS